MTMLLEQKRLLKLFLLALALILMHFFLSKSGLHYRSFGDAGFSSLTYTVETFNSTQKPVDPAQVVPKAEDVQKIMDMGPDNRIGCFDPVGNRYEHLRLNRDSISVTRKAYYFGLMLHNSMGVIEPLLAAMLRSMRFLGPHNCALSIVEGRSNDGTYEVLHLLRQELDALGVLYFLITDEKDPKKDFDADKGKQDRVRALANLRNQALSPLFEFPKHFDDKTTIIFSNDVIPCMEDILELLHQKKIQDADVMCAMDWQKTADEVYFYDTWIARSMTGNTFFYISGTDEGGIFDHRRQLFWDHYPTQLRFDNHQPIQVFSCWNGMVVLTAEPFLKKGLRFRGARTGLGESPQGEPQLLAKDLWSLGHGKIALAPSVNLGYYMDQARLVKSLKGFVSDWVGLDDHDAGEKSTVQQHIDWILNPPAYVKVGEDPQILSWKPWDEALNSSAAEVS